MRRLSIQITRRGLMYPSLAVGDVHANRDNHATDENIKVRAHFYLCTVEERVRGTMCR